MPSHDLYSAQDNNVPTNGMRYHIIILDSNDAEQLLLHIIVTDTTARHFNYDYRSAVSETVMQRRPTLQFCFASISRYVNI